MLTHHSLTNAHKQEICQWQYEGDYAVYNLPSYEIMVERKTGFMHPERMQNFHGFSENGQLIGFVNILEEPNEIFIGIGVRPEKCGQGYGRRILSQTIQIAHEKYPDKPLYLEVRTWNQRAIRCYEHAGFTIVTEPYMKTTGSGKGMFYKMTRKGTI